MTSGPDHLPSCNQKRFWRDAVLVCLHTRKNRRLLVQHYARGPRKDDSPEIGHCWNITRERVRVRLDEAEVSIHGQERAPYNCRARRHCYGQSIVRHRTRASRSFKPPTFAERLRCVGNSSGDETGSGSMKS